MLIVVNYISHKCRSIEYVISQPFVSIEVASIDVIHILCYNVSRPKEQLNFRVCGRNNSELFDIFLGISSIPFS